MRESNIERVTGETSIQARIVFEGSGKIYIKTGIGFFDHMLTLLFSHGGMDIELNCKGDLHVDSHHLVEDTGIVLGQALKAALGDKKGINRYGDAFVPMDESLGRVILDISGRPYLVYDTPPLTTMVGTMESELFEEFFRAFSVHSGITLHMKCEYGRNTHHIVEALFKALGRALKVAVTIVSDEIPSTKGFLD